ncbi:hypothetical protein [Streptomyces sp. NK08204]|uniref:hypothetical protein n=1 Tax=Streptomyces sp. NK08204 TaxID=2873260 RepID=UPI001CECCAE9|nr:hypothetical protein [Streptomyces sp. NK08204]
MTNSPPGRETSSFVYLLSVAAGLLALAGPGPDLARSAGARPGRTPRRGRAEDPRDPRRRRPARPPAKRVFFPSAFAALGDLASQAYV